MSKRKYKKGRQLTTLDEVGEQTWLIIDFGHKTITRHIGFVASMQFRVVQNQLLKGMLYAAEPIDKEATNGR